MAKGRWHITVLMGHALLSLSPLETNGFWELLNAVPWVFSLWTFTICCCSSSGDTWTTRFFCQTATSSSTTSSQSPIWFSQLMYTTSNPHVAVFLHTVGNSTSPLLLQWSDIGRQGQGQHPTRASREEPRQLKLLLQAMAPVPAGREGGGKAGHSRAVSEWKFYLKSRKSKYLINILLWNGECVPQMRHGTLLLTHLHPLLLTLHFNSESQKIVFVQEKAQ